MPNYQLGKIYKIVSDSIEGVYIGATVSSTLAKRLAIHTCHYKAWLLGKCSYITSYNLLVNNDYRIVLLENAPCNTKDELNARESYYIDNTPNCINKIKNVGKYNLLGNDEYHKLYRREHKEESRIKGAVYYNLNKQKIALHNKKLNICHCGGHYTNINYARHNRTTKHINYMKFLEPIIYEPYNIKHYNINNIDEDIILN